MTPERRRETVLQAALPLVAELGASVTTQQIARAAGIGEATVFRAFADKDELLQACLERALDPAATLEELRGIDVDQPLADHLVEAAEALTGYLNRIGMVVRALHATGLGQPGSRSRARDHDTSGRPTGRDDAQAQTRQALAELFTPTRTGYGSPATTLADIFVRLLTSGARSPSTPAISSTELVDILLNGAVST